MEQNSVHMLKTTEPYFSDIKNRKKKFDVRKNDRNFKVNDELVFCRFIDNKLTGEKIRYSIVYIMDDPLYCKPDTVILGLSSEIMNY